MIPWTLLDTAPIPGGSGELRLMRRGAEVSIVLGAVELMSSRLSGSETALASLTVARLPAGAGPRKILIGGLGMGFTLRAALDALGPAAEVIVAELVPAVVAWARGLMADVFQNCLDDPRVQIVEGDVGTLLTAGAAYDAILLDVDNGPAGQTRQSNDGLYGARGLATAHRALRPGGLLSVWSVAPDEAFAKRLRTAGFAVEELRVRANAGKRGARHVIWIGRRR